MVIGTTLIILAVVVAAIWVVIELKRFKHKIFAMLLIALIILTYVSFALVLQNQEINYKSSDGLMKAGKLYLSWLGSMLGNLKSITSNAIHMDWTYNDSPEIQDE